MNKIMAGKCLTREDIARAKEALINQTMPKTYGVRCGLCNRVLLSGEEYTTTIFPVFDKESTDCTCMQFFAEWKI